MGVREIFMTSKMRLISFLYGNVHTIILTSSMSLCAIQTIILSLVLRCFRRRRMTVSVVVDFHWKDPKKNCDFWRDLVKCDATTSAAVAVAAAFSVVISFYCLQTIGPARNKTIHTDTRSYLHRIEHNKTRRLI